MRREDEKSTHNVGSDLRRLYLHSTTGSDREPQPGRVFLDVGVRYLTSVEAQYTTPEHVTSNTEFDVFQSPITLCSGG